MAGQLYPSCVILNTLVVLWFLYIEARVPAVQGRGINTGSKRSSLLCSPTVTETHHLKAEVERSSAGIRCRFLCAVNFGARIRSVGGK